MEFLQGLVHKALETAIVSELLNLFSRLSHQVWLIPLLIVLLVKAEVTLKRQNALREKLCIEEKPYHDIVLDILYFIQNKALNKCKIDTLEWDFICDYHPGNLDFLDIEENWTINFSAETRALSVLKFGIHGGSPDDLVKDTFTARQDGRPLSLRKPLVVTGKDCESIELPLHSDVERGKSSEVAVSFVWQKFIVVNRKDDYFYFLPKSLANKVDEFRFKVKHPYACKPVVYLLKSNWRTDYKKVQITERNGSKYKASFKKQTPMEFEFSIKGLKALDVVLIIFNTPDAPTQSSPPEDRKQTAILEDLYAEQM